MKNHKYPLVVLAILIYLALEGCTAMIPKGDRPEIPVIVSTLAPTPPANNLGMVTATDGSGCGLLGLLGNRENAIYILKQQAHQAGANYVQILKTKEPYSDGQCKHNAYIIEGNAYKTIPLEDQPTGLIPIRNAGFEDDPLGKNGVSETWHFNLREWSGFSGGVVNVNFHTIMFPSLKAPDGDNMAFLAFAGSHIQQVLDFRLVPERDYQLQVVVGHRAESSFGDGDYKIELHAGSHLLVEKQGAIPPSGQFKEVTLHYTSTPSSQGIGQPLKIVLRNLNTTQVNFDKVRLNNWPAGTTTSQSNTRVSTSETATRSAIPGSTNTRSLSGSWREIIMGRDMGTARIEQEGSTLKFWNFETPPRFSEGNLDNSGVIHATGWNLTANLQDSGKKISWSNGVIWIRK